MYSTILAALDGSPHSLIASRLALALARADGSRLLACHAYSARLHKARFMDMEPGLKMEQQDQGFVHELRQTHDDLIGDGLKALSQGYMDAYVEEGRKAGVEIQALDVEGRNYVKILETAEDQGAGLIALGAQGLGALKDGRLGSVAARVARHFSGDVLVARRDFNLPLVTVGIDGSPESQIALEKGASLAQTLGGRLEAVAAYDPVFHQHVFKAMAGSLSPDRRDEVGLDKQQDLHEQIIDDGLGALYQSFLETAARSAREMGLEAATRLLQGKAYQALLKHLDRSWTDVLVMGRQGHHRERIDNLGSNTEAVLALARTNVLVVGVGTPEAMAKEEPAGLEWSPEAFERLERIPAGPRSMARRAVEEEVRSRGGDKVGLEDFQTVAARFGMARPGADGEG